MTVIPPPRIGTRVARVTTDKESRSRQLVSGSIHAVMALIPCTGLQLGTVLVATSGVAGATGEKLASVEDVPRFGRRWVGEGFMLDEYRILARDPRLGPRGLLVLRRPRT